MTNKNVPKKRGRPAGSKNLEIKNVESLLRDISENKKMTAHEQELFDEWIRNLDKAKKDTLKGHSSGIPRDLIYGIESIGDELLYGKETDVLKKFNKRIQAIKDGSTTGGVNTAQKADERAKAVWGKNRDLIRRLNSGTLTPHGAVSIISEEWVQRGDDGKKPSTQTIKNWRTRCK